MLVKFPKKNNPKQIKALLPIILSSIVIFPVTLYALKFPTFSEVVGYLTSANVSQKVEDGINQSNLQNLKVFEPNKVYAQNLDNVPVSKDLVKETSTSFEVNKDFVDALESESLENHGENAIYTVQKGDSIYSIASYFGVTPDTIMTYNHMDSITVTVGQVLEVPSDSGVMYTVKKGDTLSSVSKKYNVSSEDVTLYNGLFSGDNLAIGDEIFLPGAKGPEITKKKTSPVTKATAKTTTGKTTYAKGDTSHLNTVAAVNKYSTLPKFDYLFPAPGSVRTQKMHGNNGVDLAGKLGSPILAAETGVVTVAKTGGYNFGYGNYIIIKHSNGSETLYGHLQRVNVSVGQSVSRGEQIANLGNTGNSTGPHLHFEVHGGFNPFAW